MKTGLSELSEEIILILSVTNQASIADLKAVISKTLGYKYKSIVYLDYCIRRTCRQLKNKEILNENKGKNLTYQLSNRGKDYLKNLEAYRNLVSEISTFSIKNKGEKRND